MRTRHRDAALLTATSRVRAARCTSARHRGRSSSRPFVSLVAAVLFVTSCVTYEPAASGPMGDLVMVGMSPRASLGAADPESRLRDDVGRVPPVRVPRPQAGRPFVAVQPRTGTGGSGHAGDDRSVRGSASYCAPTPKYCHGWQPPALVAAVGSFRYGDPRYSVTVQGPAGTVTVTVVSYGVLPKGRVIDLSPAAFVQACGDLSMGVCRVVVKGLR